jgi:hypothetical protein
MGKRENSIPGTHTPEPNVAVAVAREVPVAVRRTQIVNIGVPRAPTQNAELSGCRSQRICCRSCRIGPVPVIAPLPYISRHIVQPVSVCGFCGDRLRGEAAIVERPGACAHAVCIRAPPIRCKRSCPARILPLCLGRQPVSILCKIRCPGCCIIHRSKAGK